MEALDVTKDFLVWLKTIKFQNWCCCLSVVYDSIQTNENQFKVIIFRIVSKTKKTVDRLGEFQKARCRNQISYDITAEINTFFPLTRRFCHD
jgi:hypothetical protein